MAVEFPVALTVNWNPSRRELMNSKDWSKRAKAWSQKKLPRTFANFGPERQSEGRFSA